MKRHHHALARARRGGHPNDVMRESLSLNDKLAKGITRRVGTMWCAYAFAGLALVALPAAISHGSLSLVQWISQTFLQLTLLSVIIVGQQLQGRHSEIRAEADFEVNQKSFADIEAMQRRLERIELQTQQLVQSICKDSTDNVDKTH